MCQVWSVIASVKDLLAEPIRPLKPAIGPRGSLASVKELVLPHDEAVLKLLAF
jgi:hypothetical protein